MAHHGMSRHHRFSRLMRRRNHSEPCNEENMRQEPEDSQVTLTASNGISESEVEQRVNEDNALHNDPDSSLLKRQQTGVSQEPPTKVTAVVSITASLPQPPVNPTGIVSDPALNQTTIPAIPPLSPSISTDSGLLTLSPHVPDPIVSPTPTSLTTDTETDIDTDTPASTSNNITSTAPATSTVPQSSSQLSSIVSSSGTITSTSLISRSSSSPTSTTTSSSTRISNSSSGTNTISATDSAYSSFATDSDSSSFFGGFPTAGGLGTSSTASGPSSTATNSRPPDSTPSPTTNKIVGGVVGSVAGVAFLFLIVLIYLRRRHASLRAARQGLPSGDVAGGAAGEGSVARSAEMASRQSSHDLLFTASYFAPAFMRKHWRKSNQTTGTDSTLATDPSERGFQKIAGRKIPSVLQSGGDGYGGGFGESAPPGAEMSVNFQQTLPINIRPPTSQPPTTTPYGMPLDTNFTRENQGSDPGVVIRASPARTPTTSSTNIPYAAAVSPSGSIPEQQNALSPSIPIPKRPDALGRSHPSLDGSRGSRFTESL